MAKHSMVPAVFMVFKKDDKILLGHRQNTEYMNGYYGLPAGHVEPGELPIRAGIREAREEIGVDIDADDMQFLHIEYCPAHDKTGERVNCLFLVNKWKGEPKICEPEKCSDLQWFPIDQLPENTIPHEKAVLEKVAKGIYYSEEVVS